MSIRLNKVTRDLNVGLTIIVDYLKSKGFIVDNNPNTKISEDLYLLIVNHFSKDFEFKSAAKQLVNEHAEKLQKKMLNLEIEKKVIDTISNVKPEIELISEKVTEVLESWEPPTKSNIKVIKTIDLDSLNISTRLKKKTQAEKRKERNSTPLEKDSVKPDLKETINYRQYQGEVKTFNCIYGFITTKKYGDVYFHKSNIENALDIELGDIVTFSLLKPQTTESRYQASDIKIVKKNYKIIIGQPKSIGIIEWYSNTSERGKIKYLNFEFLFTRNSLKFKSVDPKEIIDGKLCLFNFCYSLDTKKPLLAINVQIINCDKLEEDSISEIKESIRRLGYINDIEIYSFVKKILLQLNIDNIDNFEVTAFYKMNFWLDNVINRYDSSYLALQISKSESNKLLELVFSKISNLSEQSIIILELFRLIKNDAKLISKVEKWVNLCPYISIEIKSEFLNQIRKHQIEIFKKEIIWDNVSIFDFRILSTIDKISIIEKLISPLKTSPIKGEFIYSNLYDIIRKKGFNYINNNLNIFSDKCHDNIRELYQISRNACIGSNKYTEKILKIKKCIFEIHENEIYEFFKSKNENNLTDISLIIDFQLSQKLFGRVIDNETWDKICAFVTKSILIGSAKDHIEFNLGLSVLRKLDKNVITKYCDSNYREIHSTQKLRLWLYDLYGKFDYEAFYPYYYILNQAERRLFNKKAKLTMKVEIDQGLLKKKEPWKFEKIIKELNREIFVYSATWKSIWFDDKRIRICKDINSNFTDFFNWDFSEEQFNLFIDFLSRKKISPILVFLIKDEIIKIQGLEDIEEEIWKIQLLQETNLCSNHGSMIKMHGITKMPTNMILRSRCIQLLNRLQSNELAIAYVVEKSPNSINDPSNIYNKNYSILYSIKLNEIDIAVVWESLEVEKSKRTHVFKCSKIEYEKLLSEIELNISKELYVRSRLNGTTQDDFYYQKKLKYFTGINHDNSEYKIWEESLFEILPELKNLI